MFAWIVNAFCFWLLTALACLLFGVAVLMPPVREYRYHQRTARDMEAVVAELEAKVQANQDCIGLLDRRDPLLAAKQARDILNYRLEKGRDVPANIVEPPPEPDAAPPPNETELLLSGRRGPRGLEQFTDPETLKKLENPRVQRLLLVMAAIALCMAFIFFGTPTKRPAPPPPGY